MVKGSVGHGGMSALNRETSMISFRSLCGLPHVRTKTALEARIESTINYSQMNSKGIRPFGLLLPFPVVFSFWMGHLFDIISKIG